MNCSQIFCTFAVETTWRCSTLTTGVLWIALKFFVLLQSKQPIPLLHSMKFRCELLSNFLYFCSRNNKFVEGCLECLLWIALKFFVLLQSKQLGEVLYASYRVVNCSQIFCTFAVETTCKSLEVIGKMLWIALKFFVLLQSKQLTFHVVPLAISCELLSNFLYFCSRNNCPRMGMGMRCVVNCSQIFCTFAVETTSA